MINYRHVTLIYPDGRQVKSITEEKEVYGDLLRLQMLYGLKVRLGRRVSDRELAQYPGVGVERPAIQKGAVPARPLSPDFGRGSGDPI